MRGAVDASDFCPKCGNFLFDDAQGKFCVSCESGRRKTKDHPESPCSTKEAVKQ